MGYKEKVNFAICLHIDEGRIFQLFMRFLGEKYKKKNIDLDSLQEIVLDPTFPYAVIKSEEINMGSNYGFVKFCLYFVYNAHKAEFEKWVIQLKERQKNGKEEQKSD